MKKSKILKLRARDMKKKQSCATNEEGTNNGVYVNQKAHSVNLKFETLGERHEGKKQSCATNEEGTHKSA
mgnify:CR=1 FL=1